nr:Chromatin associated protein KTI12 domain containing protein [Haemonchus contortus]
MPFLLVTGHPASGKSTLVNRIQEYFVSKGKQIVIVRDDDYLDFHRSDYGNSTKEKDQRSYLRSCVQKSLTQDTVVVCDGLNYIKGYRYELFLIAKLCKTTFAVLHCHAEISTCKWLNEQKNDDARYEESTLTELIARYEKPDPRNRWDSPLYEIKVGRSDKRPEEAPDDMGINLEHPSPKFVDIPFSDIFSWMCEGKALTQNQSTQVVPTAPINFLHELDRVTQEVTNEIIQAQRNVVVGQHVVITSFDPDPNKVMVSRTRTLAELTRLRRQFINMSKANPIDSKSKIASLFIHYLNSNV